MYQKLAKVAREKKERERRKRMALGLEEEEVIVPTVRPILLKYTVSSHTMRILTHVQSRWTVITRLWI
jgi:hypothetical protein